MPIGLDKQMIEDQPQAYNPSATGYYSRGCGVRASRNKAAEDARRGGRNCKSCFPLISCPWDKDTRATKKAPTRWS